MGKRIRVLKANDIGLNVNYKNNNGILIRTLLDKKNLEDYNIISYNENNGVSQVVEALFRKYHFSHEDLIDEFKKRNEPFFKWMLKLDNIENHDGRRIWAEIHNSKQNLAHKRNIYLLGLESLEYHHVSKTKLDNEIITVKEIPNHETIWFYDKPLDDLIDDILIKLQEKGME